MTRINKSSINVGVEAASKNGLYPQIWEKYFEEAHAVIYVVDAACQSRFEDAKRALEKVLRHEDLQGAPVLIFAKKQLGLRTIWEPREKLEENAPFFSRKPGTDRTQKYRSHSQKRKQNNAVHVPDKDGTTTRQQEETAIPRD